VREGLSIEQCIPLVGDAMMALSEGQARQNLRSFISLGEGRTFAQMPAALSERGYFGAKLVSVFADPASPGRKAHQGVVVLFEGSDGRPVMIADAGEITRIRTAAASALATDTLARKEASVLAILGAGAQARAHIEAIGAVRNLDQIRIWARNRESSALLAQETGAEALASAQQAVADADIICTLTSAVEPILEGAWVSPGAHVNVVGSSGPGPREIDTALVVRSRFFVDHRPHVLAHGAEFLQAKRESAISDDHIAGEIGEVLLKRRRGRRGDGEMALNPRLHVLVASGVFDSMANCAGYQEIGAHLSGPLQNAITFKCYQGGHMMYLDAGPRVALSNDIRAMARIAAH
jgi:ornithine cyclodeaminase